MDNYFPFIEHLPKMRHPERRRRIFALTILLSSHSVLRGRSYFLTDEKVCKESPRTFRMVLGLSRRPKGKANQIALDQHNLRFPLGNPLGRLCKTDLTDNPYFNPSAQPTPQLSIVHSQIPAARQHRTHPVHRKYVFLPKTLAKTRIFQYNTPSKRGSLPPHGMFRQYGTESEWDTDHEKGTASAAQAQYRGLKNLR